ncbi:acetoin utilization protein AcuB/CBS domain-containing membrane protein [Nonomuraea solani]|uniref:Acetoin utilization protein AcuB/CBS domain-containing membrane protein n=1 Tax=Nonomuraea solani TaxID=1144553 RepID=A0A1H6EY28_9ACTN|nr:CBS domain-containing protein [Nonomuraea solani]SEH02672.1 acetoin utilization protein AcuB/CBS domain-containing membrane protein [Nonomuraea solani]
MNIESLTAAQVMSRVLVVVKPDESPLMAWELMRRAGVHHLPVVDGGHVLGILTREQLAASWSGGPEQQSGRQVRALLDRGQRPRVRPDTPLARVTAVMLDAGCDAVPVLSGGGLAGMVTARDVLAAVAGRCRSAEEPGEVVAGMFHLEPVLPHENR